jgi:hypothetical protein
MACRSWLYWSNIACVGLSVTVVGDRGVECSLVGLGGPLLDLVGEASLVGEAEWQILMSGSGVGGADGGGVCSRLMGSGGC